MKTIYILANNTYPGNLPEDYTGRVIYEGAENIMGSTVYFENGEWHCETGPAIIYENGQKLYYYKGKRIYHEKDIQALLDLGYPIVPAIKLTYYKHNTNYDFEGIEE